MYVPPDRSQRICVLKEIYASSLRRDALQCSYLHSMQPKNNFYVVLWVLLTANSTDPPQPWVLLGAGRGCQRKLNTVRGWEGKIGWCVALKCNRGEIRDLVNVLALSHFSVCTWSSELCFLSRVLEIWRKKCRALFPRDGHTTGSAVRPSPSAGSAHRRFLWQLKCLKQSLGKLSKEIILLCNSDACSCVSCQ